MDGITKPGPYQIPREWSDGFVAAIAVRPRLGAASEHWLAGYDVGYGFRKQKNERLNEYLVSIGEHPMGVVRLA
jgi:hypothetical protein